VRRAQVLSEMNRFCHECGRNQLFEQYHGEPGGCPDSPDGDCPEWGCVRCGTALFVGLAVGSPAPATLAELPGRVA
jgi:hypothetical protein